VMRMDVDDAQDSPSTPNAGRLDATLIMMTMIRLVVSNRGAIGCSARARRIDGYTESLRRRSCPAYRSGGGHGALGYPERSTAILDRGRPLTPHRRGAAAPGSPVRQVRPL